MIDISSKKDDDKTTYTITKQVMKPIIDENQNIAIQRTQVYFKELDEYQEVITINPNLIMTIKNIW